MKPGSLLAEHWAQGDTRPGSYLLMGIGQRLGYDQDQTGLAWRREIHGAWLTPGSHFEQSVQPLQRRCENCQSPWLRNTLEEFIPAAVWSGSEDLPGIKEGKDRKSIPQGREKGRRQNGSGGVTTDALRDNCKGEQRRLYLGAVIVPCRSVSHFN